MLQCVVLQYVAYVVELVAVCYSMCSVLQQCVAVCCGVLKHVVAIASALQCVAVCCSVMQ